MADVLGQVSGTLQESIARVELFTDAAIPSDQWRVVYHFESGVYGADGKLLGPTQFGSRRVERVFGDIKGDADVQTLVGIVKTKGYQYKAEDIAAAVKAAADQKAMQEEAAKAQAKTENATPA